MARADNVFIVTINHHPIIAFTVKRECRRWLEHYYPKCPTNMRVTKMTDGAPGYFGDGRDVTAAIYGLKG